MTTNRTFWLSASMLLMFVTLFCASTAQAQNVPPVSLPIHDLLEDQDAYLANSVIQTTVLAAGWNWFSTNVDITLADLQETLVSTGNTTITIKSKSQNTYYQNNRWRGSLNFDVAQMYKIYVETGCEIALEGMPINPSEHSITIHNGPNWIGFPLNESMSLANAFAGFAVNGDVIKSKSGSANYLNGQWRGAFNLEPGQGYIYKSNAQGDRILTFPTTAK